MSKKVQKGKQTNNKQTQRKQSKKVAYQSDKCTFTVSLDLQKQTAVFNGQSGDINRNSR